MTTQELNAKLAELQQTLPEPLRHALSIEQIKLRHAESIQTAIAATPANALVRAAAPKSIDEALAVYAANPVLQIVNALLLSFVQTANGAIPTAFRNIPVNVFGDANNRLDPLRFNGAASTSASGEACLPQACVDLGWPIGRICTPTICAGGGASAGLNVLNGLSSARIGTIQVTDVPSSGTIIKVNGKLAVSAGNVSASGFAEAHGGPFGISIPVSASGSAQLTGVSANGNVVITIDLSKPKITSIQLSGLTVSYSQLAINISGLGPFNSLLGPLVNSLKSIVQKFFDVNGAISNAIQGVLQDQLNNLLK